MKKILLSLSMAFAAALGANADTVDIDFSSLGYANAGKVTNITTGTSAISATFSKGGGSNDPAFYTSGSAVRIYNKNTLTISSTEEVVVKKIVFTQASASYAFDGTCSDVDGQISTSSAVTTWSGETNNIVFTNTAANNKQWRLTKMSIEYEYVTNSSVERVDISYSLDKANGIVSLTCPTEGA